MPGRIPRAGRRKDRVGRVTAETEAILRDCVADRVPRAVAVGLVEQMDPAVEHDRARRAEAIALRLLLGQDLADLLPGVEIVAAGDADGPAITRSAIAEGGKRVVEEVMAIEADDRWILGEGAAAARGICK